jgi:chemotaxis protein MotB
MLKTRRKREEEVKGNPPWLVTFTDLMALLLTFFVLLLSMSSLTPTTITEVNTWFAPRNFIERQGLGRLPERVTFLLELIKDPANMVVNLDRIKDLLFPYDLLPNEVSKTTLDENVKVLERPEGLVISLSDNLLFPSGQYALAEPAKKVLNSLVDVLLYTEMDINIAGHTDNVPNSEMSNYELSGRRALSVLEYFLQNKVRPVRFSVSGYGPDRPVADNDLESERAANRRVEILLKNSLWLGSYR